MPHNQALTLAPADFLKVVSGNANPVMMFMTGKLKAKGDLGLAAKIADLFAGVRLYGLLGLVWFDVTHPENWRLSSPEALAAFRRGARDYRRPAPGAS